jgi:hypothetical protein
MVVRSKEIAQQIPMLIPDLMAVPDKVKLYATQKTNHPAHGIELTIGHQSCLWQTQWTSFSDL